MANTTKEKLSASSDADNNPTFLLRSQKFFSGDVMVACSCGAVRVFPDAYQGGECPRGTPFRCMAQFDLPLTPVKYFREGE